MGKYDFCDRSPFLANERSRRFGRLCFSIKHQTPHPTPEIEGDWDWVKESWIFAMAINQPPAQSVPGKVFIPS